MTPKIDPDTPNDKDNISEKDLEEMDELNEQLDQLSSVLDAMERRTDDIMEQSLKLLQENRAIREEMKDSHTIAE